MDGPREPGLARLAKRLVRPVFDAIYRAVRGPVALKEFHEYRYWRLVAKREGALDNSWYEYYYTDFFGIPRSFYDGKAILDVGCGPRGSLEWAGTASRRVGLEPLVGAYRRLGIDSHAMEYVRAYAEDMPFPNGVFDVAMSMNSLDHTSRPEQVISEMLRVLRPGGTILVLSHIDRTPTACEPQSFGDDILDLFRGCTVKEARRVEDPDETGDWTTAWVGTDETPRGAGLVARLIKDQ